MLKWALIFLVIVAMARIFGFSDVEPASATIAQWLFGIFVVLFVGGLIIGLTLGAKLTSYLPSRFGCALGGYYWRKTRFRMDTAAGSSRKSAIERGHRHQTSTLAVSALSWMNCRRGSTRSPINWSKSTLASSTSLIRTCSNDRASVSSVVSHSCSGFISPRPL